MKLLNKNILYFTVVVIVLVVIGFILVKSKTEKETLSPDGLTPSVVGTSGVNEENNAKSGAQSILSPASKKEDQNKSTQEQPKLGTPASDFILPNTPTGFKWQRLEEIKGWLLIPNDWFFLHETNKGTQAYFLTKEKIEGENGFFHTGFSLNVVPKEGIPGGDSYSYAKSYVANLLEKGAELVSDEIDYGSFSDFSLMGQYPSEDGDFTMYTKVLANKKTGSLYILSFESPNSQMASTKPIADKVLKEFIFDDDI